jgi:hypothetical protein
VNFTFKSSTSIFQIKVIDNDKLIWVVCDFCCVRADPIVSGVIPGEGTRTLIFFREAQHMKTLLSVAAVLALSAAPAFAGQGHVSKNSLAKMGLAGMQVMSDEQGQQIRGLSIAVAAGGSIAFIGGEGGGAASVNTYFAAGKHEANGNNVSFAVAGDVSTGRGDDIKVSAGFVVAGGASSAHAH